LYKMWIKCSSSPKKHKKRVSLTLWCINETNILGKEEEISRICIVYFKQKKRERNPIWRRRQTNTHKKNLILFVSLCNLSNVQYPFPFYRCCRSKKVVMWTTLTTPSLPWTLLLDRVTLQEDSCCIMGKQTWSNLG